MKTKVLFGVQIIAGLLLILFGLSKFFQIMPSPPSSQEMDAFMIALVQTGYLIPLVGVIEVLAGVSFVLNKFAPLMAIVVTPVMLNAVLAHLFLDLQGIVASAIILVLTFIIMLKNKESYSPLFRA